jgi:hypothetical protein
LKDLEKGDFERLDVKKMCVEWKGYRRFGIGNIRFILV